MIIDIDTRKLELKKDDLLIFDGEKITTISLVNLIKPLVKENKELKNLARVHQKKIDKLDKFIKTIGGKFNEKN